MSKYNNKLYKNAKNPEKIFVGICQQNNTGDSDCLEELLKEIYIIFQFKI